MFSPSYPLKRIHSRAFTGLPLPLAWIATGLIAASLSAQEVTPINSPIISGDLNPSLRTTISLNAQDASLSELLKVLADRSGMNFVAGESVSHSRISIILNKTPVSEAIDLIVRAAGLGYEVIGNSVLIGDGTKLKDEVGQSGYVISLNYAEADEVAQMLGDLTKSVKVDRGGNRLIAYASPRVINEITRIVKAVDHPHTQVLLETRLLEVAVDDNNKYGIEWGSMNPISTGLAFPQVPALRGWQLSGGQRLPISVPVALDLLIQNGDARVLMNSKLTTTNNREASLLIGEKIPYVVQTYNTASNSAGANLQVQKEEVGVKMKMLPHVNDDGEITLSLEPEVSSIAGFKGPNADLPLVKVRTTKTTVRVSDGQTIFLAGLLSEEENTIESRLPILGQIPVLGILFTHKVKTMRKTNLIIEIKPKIIRKSSELQFTTDPIE